MADLLVNWIEPFHEGREWLQRDEAQRSIGMAMQTRMLAAKAMGYDSCPMIGFDIDKVAERINLPEDHLIGPMVAVGKGSKDPWPKPGQLPLSELLTENTFWSKGHFPVNSGRSPLTGSKYYNGLLVLSRSLFFWLALKAIIGPHLAKSLALLVLGRSSILGALVDSRGEF